MAKETKTPARIDPEVRHAAMGLIHALAVFHPAIKKDHRPVDYECSTCARVDTMLALLDAEQREYGPPIDATDPSWLREHPEVTA